VLTAVTVCQEILANNSKVILQHEVVCLSHGSMFINVGVFECFCLPWTAIESTTLFSVVSVLTACTSLSSFKKS